MMFPRGVGVFFKCLSAGHIFNLDVLRLFNCKLSGHSSCTFLFVLLLVLSGCGWFSKDNTRMPTELETLQQTLTLNNLWTTSLGGSDEEKYLKLYPLILQDRLFAINAQGDISALQIDNGERLWEISTEVTVSAGINGDEERLMFGTEDGDVIAVSTEDGHELWRKRLSSEIMAVSRVDLGVVVVRTNDNKLYGLDAGSGEVLWQMAHTAPVLTLRGVSVPVIYRGKLVVGFDDGKLSVLSLLRGKALWQTSVGVPRGRSELERMVDIDGTIKVVDGIIYAVGFHGQAVAVTLVDGRVLWARELSSHSGLDVDSHRIYVTDEDSNVWALDRRTGASLWKQDKLKYRSLSAPTVIQDHVIVGDFEGYIHWMAKADGHFVARTLVDNNGILAKPVVTDSRAYIQGRGGDIVALEIPGEAEEQP